MYLSKVKINNYRNFGKGFSLNLQPYSIIVGANDVGKSNLLRAIQLVLGQGAYSIFKRRSLEQADINFNVQKDLLIKIMDEDVSPEEIKLPDIKISLYFGGLNDEQRAIAGDWCQDIELETFALHYSFSYGKSEQELHAWVASIRESNKGKSSDDVILNLPIHQYVDSLVAGFGEKQVDAYRLNYFGIEILDALRDANRELVASSDNKLLYKIINSDGLEFEDILSKLGELDLLVDANPHLSAVADEVKKLLDDFSFDHQTDNEVKFLFSRLEQNEVLHKLSLQYGNNPASLERNGLGRNNLLFMTLILSKLFKDSSSRKLFRLICIEEPEAHLHPEMIRQLAYSLESQAKDREDIQLLITSHSADFASSSNLGNIVMLFDEIDSGEILSNKLSSELEDHKDSLRYLEKYLDATTSTMLFSRKLLFVEGISEQILIPVFWQIHLGESITKFACGIVNVQGLAFEHFLRIMKSGYFIKSAVITDRDRDDGSESGRITNLKTYSTDKVCICITGKKTFEQDLIEANKTDVLAKTILNALELTRPRKYNEYKKKNSDTVVTSEVFNLIKEYKAEFSMNIKDLVEDGAKLLVPKYITSAFDHIHDQTSTKEESADEGKASAGGSGSR